VGCFLFLSAAKILPCQGRLICAPETFLTATLAAHISRSSQTLDTTHQTQWKQVNRHNVAIGLVANHMLSPIITKATIFFAQHIEKIQCVML